MKKLLITTMAAVSVGLCAKAADDYNGTKTSFENYEPGSTLTVNDDTWTSTATDPLFVISNKTDFANWTKPSRPDFWATSSDEKALTIDTDAPLFCNVNNWNTPYTFSESNGPIFFDSVVQFTATDVATEPDSKDKLRVWLYSSPENLDGTVFGEEEAITRLVVTAGYYKPNDSTTYKTNYLTNVSISPDSWHRLTIKTFVEGGYTKFNIYVDGDIVKVGELQDFDCLYKVDGQDTLQCVAFDGKGAVDDIVFTTTDPFYVAPEVAETFALNVSISAADEADALLLAVKTNNVSVTAVNGSYTLELGTGDVKAYVECLSGYKVSDSQANYDADKGYWIVPIDVSGATADGTLNVTITVEEAGGGSGEEPEDPEVPAKPTIGGVDVDKADEFIAAANSGATIKVPTDWTLDGNTLKNADGATYATFADYYKVTLATDGTVTLELNDEAKPEIDETSADKGDAIVVTDAAVALGVTNAKVGLWYGAQAYSDAACTTKVGDVTDWAQATSETVTVTATKPVGDKAFFKVVVTDIPPEE